MIKVAKPFLPGGGSRPLRRCQWVCTETAAVGRTQVVASSDARGAAWLTVDIARAALKERGIPATKLTQQARIFGAEYRLVHDDTTLPTETPIPTRLWIRVVYHEEGSTTFGERVVRPLAHPVQPDIVGTCAVARQ